jgi:hypothetical protein
MRRLALSILLGVPTVVLAAAPASQPVSATRPATTQEAKAEERLDMAKRIGDIPAIGPYDVSQVIRIRIENQRLVVTSPLESFDGQRLVKFKHGDDSATIDFHPMGASPAPDQPRFIQMYRYDFRDPNTVFFHTSVLAHPGYTQIAGSWQLVEGMRDVSVIDTEERLDDAGGKTDAAITIRVHAIDDDGNETHKLEFTAPDLRTLLREHPAEVNEYLRPVLRQLDAESLLDLDPTLAWQVFASDARPDTKLTADVKGLLPKLDASEFADREQAADALRKLGPPAAVAMLQLDRTKLSAEQNSRLDEILTPYQQLDPAEADRLGEDTAFLLSAMDSQDAELRRVASSRLAKKVGGDLKYDPSASPEQRHDAVESLRRTLLPPPATQAVERRGE